MASIPKFNSFILGKHNQEFPKKLGRLVINYFLPKLLVTYGTWKNHRNIEGKILCLLVDREATTMDKLEPYEIFQHHNIFHSTHSTSKNIPSHIQSYNN